MDKVYKPTIKSVHNLLDTALSAVHNKICTEEEAIEMLGKGMKIYWDSKHKNVAL